MGVNRNSVALFMVVIVFIAALLDIKYRGLFFRMLPCSVQKNLGAVFNHEKCSCTCYCSER